jgi:hypothetical protein
MCAEQGAGPPKSIDIQNLSRYVDVPLLRHFLGYQSLGEKRAKILSGSWLVGARV